MKAEESDISAISKKTMSRTELMAICSDLVSELCRKSISGRYRNPETEKLRDSKTRLLIQSIGAYGSLLRDEQLDQILARVEALEGERK
jgi:hypothetical protein